MILKLFGGPRPELNDFNGDGIIDILWQVGNLHEDGIGGYYGGCLSTRFNRVKR